MNRTICFFLLVCNFKIAHSQKYALSEVPDSLKENAHCIIREYNRKISLSSVNEGVIQINRAVTIMDKEGEEGAWLRVFYDKNSNVEIEAIIIYAADGKAVGKVNLRDIEDVPLNDQSLFSDARMKVWIPAYSEYPYTVDYVYNIHSTNMISYGCWSPVEDYHYSVQHAALRIDYPFNLTVNRKEIKTERKLAFTIKENKTEIWELNNITAIEREPFGTGLQERIPKVYLMPSELRYNKYKGLAGNWQEYGNWMFELYSDRSELPENEKEKLASYLSGTTDTLQKVKALYSYLQHNTRYVNIRLGLGGFQPISAKVVSETGYGDCKALTNYMSALLKAAGIVSYPAIVISGQYNEPVFRDFPNFLQFNHVILCVPVAHDTIWLECTNQKMPFGYLGSFTDDRETLLITKEGGKFARTKKYEASKNIRSNKSYIAIDSAGSAAGRTTEYYGGLQYDQFFDLMNLNYDEQKKWLYADSQFPSIKINDFKLSNYDVGEVHGIIDESFLSTHYGTFSGPYMLFPLNCGNVQASFKRSLKSRHSDLIIRRSEIEYDTIVYKLPANYALEDLPKETSIQTKFGKYQASASMNQSELLYFRRFQINQGIYSASDYNDFFEFIKSISKADHVKIMLAKKP